MRLNEPGVDGAQQIFHCALYSVPMLIYYTGCRREEICGAMVDGCDLRQRRTFLISTSPKMIDGGSRTPSPSAKIPLHPELIRLNFLDYVKAIKALGYKLLFPDLFSPSSSSPLGDRFYKQFKPILIAAGVTEAGLRISRRASSVRCSIEEEAGREGGRADLLGHGGDTETSERYCEPHEIATLLKFVKELPVVTADLQPQEINLIPWVAEKQVAPFSHPSRSKRVERLDRDFRPVGSNGFPLIRSRAKAYQPAN